LNQQHIITYSKDRLIIVTKEILQHLQTFRDFTSDIKAVASSQKTGVLVIFCERELIAFKPNLNGNTI
jgi:predicted HAD superfamily phosphohydrolase